MNSLPAGWYEDPDQGGDGRLRWFDGNDWTEQVAPGPTPHQQRMLAVAEKSHRSGVRIRRLVWWPVIGGLALIALIFVIAAVAAVAL